MHDRLGQAHVTDQVRRARQALGAQDKGACATGEFCRDRDFSITTNLDSDEKKKKDPKDLGHHMTP